MRKTKNIFQHVDKPLVIIYLMLIFIGWISIYAAVYDDAHKNIYDLSQSYGKQLLWIVTGVFLAIIILAIDGKFFTTLAYPLYAISLILLIAVIFLGVEINASKSWFEIGNFRIQPAEFAKFTTALALAKYLSTFNTKLENLKTKVYSSIIILLPVIIIVLQNDTGSALVYFAFIFVLYREGLSGNWLIVGLIMTALFILALIVNEFILMGSLTLLFLILLYYTPKKKKAIIVISSIYIMSMAFVFAVDYTYDNILQRHQKERIDVLLGREVDLRGAGYNLHQSKIAIGSGGIFGKGFLNGTQTKYNFVPEQSTDFIFCTIGEEWGFVGSVFVIFLFILLLVRLVKLAERQRSTFSRVYGYAVASILFFHIFVNIGMTMGLAPVIGIPLPFISYGGSSMWAFTIMLFIFIKLDAYRLQVL